MRQHNIDPLQMARSIEESGARKAQSSFAFDRGNVESVDGNGKAVVVLRNGKKIRIGRKDGGQFGPGQSIVMLKRGSQREYLVESVYQGGNGAPFSPPE